MKNRFIIQFTETPPSTTGNGPSRLAFCAHTCTRPEISFNPVEHGRLNERFWVAGKPTWNDLAMSFFGFESHQYNNSDVDADVSFVDDVALCLIGDSQSIIRKVSTACSVCHCVFAKFGLKLNFSAGKSPSI